MATGLSHNISSSFALKFLLQPGKSDLIKITLILSGFVSTHPQHHNNATSNIGAKFRFSKLALTCPGAIPESQSKQQHHQNIHLFHHHRQVLNNIFNTNNPIPFTLLQTKYNRFFNHSSPYVVENFINRGIHTFNGSKLFRPHKSGEDSDSDSIVTYSSKDIMSSQMNAPHNNPITNGGAKDSLNLDKMVNGLNENGTGTTIDHTKDLLAPKDIKIPIPNGHIAAKAWGNPNAKLKVMALHGWLDNCGSFDNLIPLLIDTEDYYVVAYDDIGTGLSSHIPDGMVYDRSLLILIARRVIKHLGWTEYMLMGHSLGAITFASYAAIYPTEVKRLISIDVVMPPVFKPPNWQGKARNYIEACLNYEVDKTCYTYEDAVKRIIEGHMRSLSIDDAKTLMKRGTTKVEYPGKKPMYVFNRDVRLRQLFMEFLTDKQYAEIYKNIRCHLLILRSTLVDHQQFGDLEITYKSFKEATMSFKEELISGTHHINLGNPGDCANAIKKWMKQCDMIDDKKDTS